MGIDAERCTGCGSGPERGAEVDSNSRRRRLLKRKGKLTVSDNVGQNVALSKVVGKKF